MAKSAAAKMKRRDGGQTLARRRTQTTGAARHRQTLSTEQQAPYVSRAENKQLRGDVEILKNISLLCPGTAVSFAFARQLQEKAVTVGQACRVLQVSRSGYYGASAQSVNRWCASGRAAESCICLKQAYLRQSTFAHSAGLTPRDCAVGRYRVRRLMCEHGLPFGMEAQIRARPDSRAVAISPNNAEPASSTRRRPTGRKFGRHHIRTPQRLAVSGSGAGLVCTQVVGWAMAADFIRAGGWYAERCSCIAQRQPAPGLIVHTDRGSQYAN